MEIILASKSPRRIEVLNLLKLPFQVMVSDYDESLIPFQTPEQYVSELAFSKCQTIAEIKEGIIIGADTIVFSDTQLFEKPKNEAQAKLFLESLSGNWHQVYTGVVMMDTKDKTVFRNVTVSNVKFKELSDQDITWYIHSKEWQDKAGGYAIQGLGSILIEKIEGDFFNIMGLSPGVVFQGLKQLGYPVYQME